MVNDRTALISQLRGLLLDRWLAIAVSATRQSGRSVPRDPCARVHLKTFRTKIPESSPV